MAPDEKVAMATFTFVCGDSENHAGMPTSSIGTTESKYTAPQTRPTSLLSRRHPSYGQVPH